MAVDWEFKEAPHGRSTVLNVGRAKAKGVRVRVGSASDDSNVVNEASAATVARGEVVPLVVARTYGMAADFAVTVTWRGRFGRRKRWVYIVP